MRIYSPAGARKSQFGRDNQLREVSTHKIYIRYRSDVTHKHRLVQTYKRDGVSTTPFNIKGVLNVDNRFKMLELTCDEGVPT